MKPQAKKDAPLVLFTLLAQNAVGLFVTAGLLQVLASRLVSPQAAAWLAGGVQDQVRLVSLVLAGASMLASLFHLGSPYNAYRALANLRTSWLSREILCMLGFFAALGVAHVSYRKGLGPAALRSALDWAAGLWGLALVYSMARVYRLHTVPGWNRSTTPGQFFASTFLLGGLLAGGLLVAGLGQGQDWGPGLVRALLAAILVFLAVSLGLAWVSFPFRPAAVYGVRSPVAARDLAGVRLGLALWGWLLLAGLLLDAAGLAGRELIPLLLAGFGGGLVLAAEVVGRFLFYAARGEG